jgi:hypothetical protein
MFQKVLTIVIMLVLAISCVLMFLCLHDIRNEYVGISVKEKILDSSTVNGLPEWTKNKVEWGIMEFVLLLIVLCTFCMGILLLTYEKKRQA